MFCFVFSHVDGDLNQITNHRLDIATNVTHLGKLGCLNLEKRRLRENCQTPGDFGLTNAGRTDHDDVFRGDLFSQRRGYLLAPPAIAQGDGDEAFGIGLADDVFVQFGNGLFGRQGLMVDHNVSITIDWLV